MTYYSVFWQNNQGLDACWDKLNSSLHTTYIGGPGVMVTTPCRHCRGVDHSSINFALSPLTPPIRSGALQQSEPALSDCRACQSNQKQVDSFICRSWNWDKCCFPGNCYYKHLCAICGENHMAKECPRQAPEDAKRLHTQCGDGWH